MKRPLGCFVIFLLLIVAGFLIYHYTTSALTTRIEQSIREAILEASGGTGQITLRLSKVGLSNLFGGRLRGLVLLAENIDFEGLTYRTIELHSDEIVIDRQLMRTRQKFVASSIGPTVVRAVIEEQELNNYRAKRWPSLPLILSLKEGKVHTSVSFDLGFGPVSVAFSGLLLPVKDAIRFQPEQLELQEVVIPRTIIEQVLGPLEDALTIDFPVRLPLPVQPSQVEVRDRLAEITLTGGMAALGVQK